jgi:hypothetical protein
MVRSHDRSCGEVICNVLAALMVLGCLAAATPARADSSLEGLGVVWAKDVRTRTLTIGPNTYHLTSTTTLYGSDWAPLTMHQLPTARDESGWLRDVSQAAVTFNAVEHRGRLYLDSLHLLEPAGSSSSS